MIVQAECKLAPVEPAPVDDPVLPDLPAMKVWDVSTPVTAWILRTKRAELAGLHFQGERDAERDARVTNAKTQTVCASWAKAQQ